jgi:hypothetical protein
MKTHETNLQELQKKHEWAERMRRNAIIALESAAEARDHWEREATRLAGLIAEAESVVSIVNHIDRILIHKGI